LGDQLQYLAGVRCLGDSNLESLAKKF
jgi:hypothetical protein